MKTTDIYKNAENLNVCFHIGRGDHFNNQGHKTFNGYVTKLQECFGERTMLLNDDEDGNLLPDDQWQLVDGGSNVILEGREAIESETGVLDWDGEYDTDIVQPIDECSDEEYDLIIEAYCKDEYVDPDVVRYAATVRDVRMVIRPRWHPGLNVSDPGLTFTDDSVIIKVNADDDLVLPRTECTTKDETRSLLEGYNFIECDIDSIINAMSDECWFDEDEDED